MAETLNVYQRLKIVQETAHAPREIKNRFGQGRSAEQILEAYKPVCNANGLYLCTSDEVVTVGDRNYIASTATVVNIEKPEESHSVMAQAWEGDVANGLDTSQVSGKTSSYAKKYALQNLFAIDDTKDADNSPAPEPKPSAAPAKPVTDRTAMTSAQSAKIYSLGRQLNIATDLMETRVASLKTKSDADAAIQALEDKIAVSEAMS